MKKGHTHCHDQATVEIKSGKTISDDYFKNLSLFAHRMDLADNSHILQPHLVYGGEASQDRSKACVLSWKIISVYHAWSVIEPENPCFEAAKAIFVR